jgi:tripartite-type tricarboxylate transporter receptor subunit TctC
MLATHLSAVLGKTMIIDNRTGAQGIIGTDIVAKAPPSVGVEIDIKADQEMRNTVRVKSRNGPRSLLLRRWRAKRNN